MQYVLDWFLEGGYDKMSPTIYKVGCTPTIRISNSSPAEDAKSAQPPYCGVTELIIVRNKRIGYIGGKIEHCGAEGL